MRCRLVGLQRVLGVVLLVSPWICFGQSSDAPPQDKDAKTEPAAAKRPVFEVASIKPVEPGKEKFFMSPFSAAHFTATGVPLGTLIQIAYSVQDYQLQNKPKWLDSQMFDISAKPEGDGGLTEKQFLLALQQLLEERFHLKMHHEMKIFSGYELVVAKGGQKLTVSKEHAAETGYIFPGEIRFGASTLSALASALVYSTGKPVIDKTGLSGTYDIDVKFAPPEDPNSELPSLFTALEEKFGLRLQSKSISVDTLVIDHADEVPITD